MALIAALREVRRDVVRVGRSLVVLQVAAYTGIGRQVVIIVDVAIRALPRRNSVHPGQREIRGVVVERGVRPRRGVVAQGASLRKTCGGVIRIVGALIVLQMARDASGAGQIEIVVDVAVGTLTGRDRMSSRQGEAGSAVIEVRIGPGIRAMAELAVSGEATRDMTGTGGGFEI